MEAINGILEYAKNGTVWKFPPQWVRGVELHQHIEVIMHLLFLGVVKTSLQMVQEWTKKRGKHASFLR